MDIRQLDRTSMRQLVTLLIEVLDSRMQKKVIMGEEVLVKGSLSKALQLPAIARHLESPRTDKQQQGKDELVQIWETLSPVTRDAVIRQLGWYDPAELDWDDPRSNRKPPLNTDE